MEQQIGLQSFVDKDSSTGGARFTPGGHGNAGRWMRTGIDAGYALMYISGRTGHGDGALPV